jgi:hypothetical protein
MIAANLPFDLQLPLAGVLLALGTWLEFGLSYGESSLQLRLLCYATRLLIRAPDAKDHP